MKTSHSHSHSINRITLFKKIYIFNWRTIALHYCVGFCHIHPQDHSWYILEPRKVWVLIIFPWWALMHLTNIYQWPKMRPQFESWVGKFLWRRDRLPTAVFLGFLGGSDSRESYLQCRKPGFDPWVGKIPWRRKWLPTPVFWPGKSPWTE